MTSLRGFLRMRWLLTAAVLAVLLAAVLALGILFFRQQTQLQAQQAALRAQLAELQAQQAALRADCAFWYPLTSLPVTVITPGMPPTRLSVALITASRIAYEGQDCGHIPPASVSLEKWAAFYGIQVP